MKGDVKQIVKHTMINPALTECSLRNVHILVAYLLDYQLQYWSYVWSTINLAFHRHTNGPTRWAGRENLQLVVEFGTGDDALSTGKHYCAMSAWASCSNAG